MGQADASSEIFDLFNFKLMRERRDRLVNLLAAVTQRVTSSRPYFVVSSALAKPALFATSASRKATTKATSQFLAQMNMPSREDVLALSQRLTRMEMVLDDISAAMDAVSSAAASAKTRGPRQPRDADRSNGDSAKAG